MENSVRLQQLEALLRDDPQDAFLRYALAMECLALGHAGRAQTELSALLAQSPEYVPAWLQAGKLALEAGDETRAGNLWRQGIDQAERQGDLHAAEEMKRFLSELP